LTYNASKAFAAGPTGGVYRVPQTPLLDLRGPRRGRKGRETDVRKKTKEEKIGGINPCND